MEVFRMKRLFIATVFTLLTISALAQGGFQRVDSFLVLSGTDTLRLAWAGGFNASTVQNIDLDGQGGEDIIVLDKSGKLIPLVRTGNYFRHAPEYETGFPNLKQWVIAVDYNCDGKKDLFTYGVGTLTLYKNVSQTGAPAFQLVTTAIKSFQPPNTFPIYSGSVDLPSFTDIDGDGDIDILVFNINGMTVDFHRNMSMDNYGHCDSLAFALDTDCWGHFEEGVSSNHIYLGACTKSGQERHSGSTILAFDNDQDSDMDLLLGDVNDSGLVFLRNGGSPQNAAMDTVHYKFPYYGTPVNMERFVAPMQADINGDGKPDFLAAPFTVGSSENTASLAYFENTGSGAPVFNFVKNNLFQDEMIEVGEGSYPVFFDYDANGIMDLIVGNYGYYQGMGNYGGRLALFKNQGSNAVPEYVLIDQDYAGLSIYNLQNLFPAFGDLDGDGDQDMILGEATGTLLYFENIAGSSSPATFSFVQAGYGGIDVGNFATPVIADMDNDGKKDLVIGEASGTLNYVRNTGSGSSPVHLSSNLIANFGGVSVATQGFTIGYSTPALVKSGNEWLLLCGSEKGKVHLFGNISGNLNGTFTELNSDLNNVYEGTRSAPAIFMQNAFRTDVVIGSYRGGLGYYSGTGLVSVLENTLDESLFRLFPNPSGNQVYVEYAGMKGILFLRDLSGRVVKSMEFDGRLALDLSELSSGIYLVSLENGKGSIFKKLVKL